MNKKITYLAIGILLISGILLAKPFAEPLTKETLQLAKNKLANPFSQFYPNNTISNLLKLNQTKSQYFFALNDPNQ